MRNTVLLLLLLASVSALSFAQTVTTNQFEQQTQASALEIANNWQVIAVLSLLLSIILVAIAYSIGIGLEMPEITAWAGNELSQIVANAFIIVALIGTIALMDGIVMTIVAGSGIDVPECMTPGKSCLQAVTTTYLQDYNMTAHDGAKDVLTQNMLATAMAGRRLGLYCTTAFLPLFCLQAGITSTIGAHYVLDQDMYAILFEYYTNLLSSIAAQQFFVTEICFKMGPIILAIGIVARAFFFTRKLGGLFIAIAAGLMFFFPAMYIFDWMTLDMAVAGDKLMDKDMSLCPAECSLSPPLAVYDGGVLLSQKEIYDAFTDAEASKAQGIFDGSIATATGSNENSSANGKTITNCFYGGYAACPRDCRELPYPPSASNCSNFVVEAACQLVPEVCKIRRLVNTSSEKFDNNEYGKCPSSCKVVPPLKSDCSTGNVLCIGSRFDCRIAHRSDLTWRPTTEDIEGSNYWECVAAKYCPASLTATENCVWVIPDSGRCDELCTDCAPECRIQGATLANLPAQCKDENGNLKATCQSCLTTYDSCTVNISQINALAPPSGTCDSCIAEKRIVYSTLPSDYITGACALEQCGKDYRVSIPRNTCESCLFTEESYVYSPPINTQCTDTCAPSSKSAAKKPGEYMKIGGEGLVGKPEIQNVSKLLIPAYLLPLFNIVATLVFIKGLSSMLGGDIEIPGLAKVF